MLAHIVTIARIRQSQTPNDGRNGAVDDTVLSEVVVLRGSVSLAASDPLVGRNEEVVSVCVLGIALVAHWPDPHLLGLARSWRGAITL
ncbi:hypothetical protein TcasGA2_TC000893 [Tribolium castaneum]|uniref:Uncharacterized protein n=1 Tax=Tribolium castaneum TaxID=7070 RepID=D6W911_TRICA|nr:hypothetical protein TcasGA2_TC000893 [Tribolium castaneum]